MSRILDERVKKKTIDKDRKRRRNIDPETIENTNKVRRGSRDLGKSHKDPVKDKVPDDLEKSSSHDNKSTKNRNDVDDDVNSLNKTDAIFTSFEVSSREEEIGIPQQDNGNKDEDEESGSKDKRKDDDDKKPTQPLNRKNRRKTKKHVEESMDGVVPVRVVINSHCLVVNEKSSYCKVIERYNGNDDGRERVDGEHYCIYADCTDPVLIVYVSDRCNDALLRHLKRNHSLCYTLICKKCGTLFSRRLALLSHLSRCYP